MNNGLLRLSELDRARAAMPGARLATLECPCQPGERTTIYKVFSERVLLQGVLFTLTKDLVVHNMAVGRVQVLTQYPVPAALFGPAFSMGGVPSMNLYLDPGVNFWATVGNTGSKTDALEIELWGWDCKALKALEGTFS
jgi:hypothetical protein